MSPLTRAGFAAVVLVVAAMVLNLARAGLVAAGLPVEPALGVAANTTLTASVGALVYLVHRNGGRR